MHAKSTVYIMCMCTGPQFPYDLVQYFCAWALCNVRISQWADTACSLLGVCRVWMLALILCIWVTITSTSGVFVLVDGKENITGASCWRSGRPWAPVYVQTQRHTLTHASTESDIHTHAWHHARAVNCNVHDQDHAKNWLHLHMHSILYSYNYISKERRAYTM